MIHAAYGSVKDISVYNGVGVPTQQMYIVGKQNTSRKYDKQAQVGVLVMYWSKSSLAFKTLANKIIILCFLNTSLKFSNIIPYIFGDCKYLLLTPHVLLPSK